MQRFNAKDLLTINLLACIVLASLLLEKWVGMIDSVRGAWAE